MTPAKQGLHWVAPPEGPVWVVRWVKRNGRRRRVGHRFYFSAFHAHCLHKSLLKAGYDVHLYSTDTDWRAMRHGGWRI